MTCQHAPSRPDITSTIGNINTSIKHDKDDDMRPHILDFVHKTAVCGDGVHGDGKPELLE